MWLDGYHQQFGNRLEDFLSIAVPAALAELTPSQEKQVTDGSKEFPFEILLGILNSKHSYEDKVSRILAITGTWMNAASESQWALGPLSSTDYSERVGIGVRWGEISFSPLLNISENLVDSYPTWPGVLMEFAHMQETDRDYYRQRIQETSSASTPESMLTSDKYQPKQ
ncbi:Hypothetical protein Cul210931_1836 [Corynebacterium ulcerans]|uniref:Uncharacterized protein n=1 Tax=Corynebacterium ulcerans FRC58 TaxID=1408268 RepID=A0ABM5U2X3_CORUL|nr:hypothetical protein [Corynebacterium ulcerans]AIT89860.1 Hypothetical protein Cul210932_1948 [Corynebacterium ulcerans]AIU31151.1 Hypothetical protein Cul210931_1836 [Corynebacterium ulcerans]AIU92479.1 Hypothetical protein Cul05146_1937 [Corynebacterium ulcerans]AKN77822.1 Hypothetical protein CulFRC58_1968 [Corynebacterium ulcerans FRC58]ALD95655.1 Hypothetical protein Cul131001_1980 [Corynebacterium ulcerans]